jgi:hypothetical protein
MDLLSGLLFRFSERRRRFLNSASGNRSRYCARRRGYGFFNWNRQDKKGHGDTYRGPVQKTRTHHLSDFCRVISSWQRGDVADGWSGACEEAFWR